MQRKTKIVKLLYCGSKRDIFTKRIGGAEIPSLNLAAAVYQCISVH